MDASDAPEGAVVGIGGSAPHATRALRRRVCRVCGQHHASREPHVYDYVDEVDEDVSCHICLQPLVTPVDTPCGHTFCEPCLLAFLKVQQSCPIDRKPLAQQVCSFSSLVLRKLLEKLTVKCPNTEFCTVTLQRGDLEDHLKYRCPGNWVSCSYSTAGCTFRGPQRTMTTHINTCGFKDQGVNRSPIVEGEISFVEIPRTQTALGIAIVGGADTPLRCVVIQEVFPDGLLSQDGRLQAGDQIIEIDGTDMTNASHHQVCTALRRTPPVLRLGIYRHRVDAYRTNLNSSDPASNPSSPVNVPRSPPPASLPSPQTEQPKFVESDSLLYGDANGNESARESPKQENVHDELVHVTLMREIGRQLGIKLGGKRSDPGIYIMELMPGSVAEQDGRLQPGDRILAINGGDVRYSRLDHAFRLIKQSQRHVSLIVSRSPLRGEFNHLFKKPHPDLVVAHSRTKSAPDRLLEQKKDQSGREFNKSFGNCKDVMENGATERSASCESLDEPSRRLGGVSRFHSNGSIISHSKYSTGNSLGSFTDFETLNQSNNCSLGSITSGLNKSSRSLTSPISQYVIGEDEEPTIPPALPPRSRQPLNQSHSFDQLNESELSNESAKEFFPDLEPKEPKVGGTALPASGCAANYAEGHSHLSRVPKSRRSGDCTDFGELSIVMRKSLRIEGSQLHQKTVTISKDASESLGMRIGGGVSSNEGDIPIYIANIHPQGPVGKSKQVKKGDILLSVNGNSLLGLTHTQSVSLLKATAELAGVTLSLLEGSETHAGPANFVPSWLYWQRLPRALHISKNIVLHRPPGASLGFSIVGGSDPQRGPEPIHVLFLVSTSPAAVDGRLRCGDRLLAVDGHCLENVSHSMAVSLLKQAGQRVILEVVSWMGTEL